MKKLKLDIGKLQLNKEKIAQLTNSQMDAIQGGSGMTACLPSYDTQCQGTFGNGCNTNEGSCWCGSQGCGTATCPNSNGCCQLLTCMFTG